MHMLTFSLKHWHLQERIVRLVWFVIMQALIGERFLDLEIPTESLFSDGAPFPGKEATLLHPFERPLGNHSDNSQYLSQTVPLILFVNPEKIGRASCRERV